VAPEEIYQVAAEYSNDPATLNELQFDMKRVLTRAFTSGLPALVNVEVDPQPASIATVWLHATMK
jgi:hypothetical protein